MLIVATLVCAWLLRSVPWGAPEMHHTAPWRTPGSAVGVYVEAARAIRQGQSPYFPALAWAAAHTPTDWRNVYIEVYAYPPLLAVLFVPLTLLPLTAIAIAWELLSIGCAIYVAAVLARLIVPRVGNLDRALAVAIVLAAMLLFGPLRHSMRGAQSDIELIALVVGAWRAHRTNHPILSGVLLGLAVAVKPTYLLLLVPYLWMREWRAIMAMLLTSVSALMLPFLAISKHSLSDFLQVSASWNAPGFVMAPRSVSILGVLERGVYSSPSLWHLFATPVIARAAELAVIAAVFLVASQIMPGIADRSDDRLDFAWGLGLFVMLLGSPLTEDNHLALTLIPLSMVVSMLLIKSRAGGRILWVPLVCAALYFVYMTLPVRNAVTFSTATYHGWRILLTGYWFYGTVALAALYVASRRPPGRAATSALAVAMGDLRKRLS